MKEGGYVRRQQKVFLLPVVIGISSGLLACRRPFLSCFVSRPPLLRSRRARSPMGIGQDGASNGKHLQAQRQSWLPTEQQATSIGRKEEKRKNRLSLSLTPSVAPSLGQVPRGCLIFCRHLQLLSNGQAPKTQPSPAPSSSSSLRGSRLTTSS